MTTADDLRRLDFNPLLETPFVRMADGRHLAPQPSFVMARVSPAGLYPLGQRKWGPSFTRDLGKVLNRYVGEQLALLPLPSVAHPELEYQSGQWSTDHLLPGLVVLVEVKSARVALPGRLDLAGYLEDVRKDVGKAFGQLSRTAGLIQDGHPAFAHIPTDRPMHGLVVTAEPHWLINSPLFRAHLPMPSLPVTVVSITELERLVTACMTNGAPPQPDERCSRGRPRS